MQHFGIMPWECVAEFVFFYRKVRKGKTIQYFRYETLRTLRLMLFMMGNNEAGLSSITVISMITGNDR